MATANRRTEEKGQRTPRSLDAYQDKDGVKGAAYCTCGVVFRNKRWVQETSDEVRQEGQNIVCPACHRISDQNPAGIICLSGDFYAVHEDEINNLVKNTVQSSAAKNPLGRVMEISKEEGGITITTTDVKLAQKIGRVVFKAHGGELHYTWSHAGPPVRVTWCR
ncbi:MAG: BCAM0308 family protein [Desulfuromonadales bacterium]|nr:BCAM0308 family protein [Desulfuromonadales bacterium]